MTFQGDTDHKGRTQTFGVKSISYELCNFGKTIYLVLSYSAAII